MTPSHAMTEYFEARQEWRESLREEVIVKSRVQKARNRFNLAKQELRAEEEELIELSPSL